jgi:hypothetical protein
LRSILLSGILEFASRTTQSVSQREMVYFSSGFAYNDEKRNEVCIGS